MHTMHAKTSNTALNDPHHNRQPDTKATVVTIHECWETRHRRTTSSRKDCDNGVFEGLQGLCILVFHSAYVYYVYSVTDISCHILIFTRT